MMNDSRVDPFDAARERLMEGKRRRRRVRPDGPKTIVPVVEPAAPEDALSPDRLDAARASLRARIAPKPDGQ